LRAGRGDQGARAAGFAGRQFQEIGKALSRVIGQWRESASPALRIDGVELCGLDQRVRPIWSNLDLDW
jgi:hypothetical protein